MWNHRVARCAAIVFALACAGCGSSSGGSSGSSTATTSTSTATAAKSPASTGQAGQIVLTSSAFAAGGPIAGAYTCDGADISPPLEWHGVPAGTKELLLLVLALDASGHDSFRWAVAGISPSVEHFSEGAPPAGSVQGANGAGKSSWGGICGVKGEAQRVIFVLYALRGKLGLAPGFSPVVAREKLKRLKLASGLTVASYERA